MPAQAVCKASFKKRGKKSTKFVSPTAKKRSSFGTMRVWLGAWFAIWHVHFDLGPRIVGI